MTKTKNTKPFYNTEIPGDWEIKKLGDLGKVVSGLTYSPDDICEETGVLVLRSSNVQGGQITFDDNVFVKVKERDFNPVVNGDILICVRNGSKSLIGKCALINEKAAGLAFGAFMAIYRGKYNNYLIHVFNTDIYNREIHRNLGATINSINGSDLKEFKIPLPPLPEQKAIAQVLSTADAAIHTTEKLIAQKVLRKKWLMQQLLTGKKRLKGFGGEWKKLGAGEIFKSITKKGFADEELLSATQDRGMIPRTMLEGRVTMPTTGTEGFKLVEIGDFVISLRSFQGGLEYSYYRGLVSPAYTVLKPKKEINEEFYKQYFKSYEFIGRLATAVIGIRDGKQISYDDFCIVKIPNPTIEEQTAIAQVLLVVDKEISLLKAKAKKLREQKKGLMQQLLTGKKRLKIK
jgi:type I restriction enzyme S subunit